MPGAWARSSFTAAGNTIELWQPVPRRRAAGERVRRDGGLRQAVQHLPGEVRQCARISAASRTCRATTVVMRYAVSDGRRAEVSREQRIIAAARGWIGTPYRHQASLKGVGADCLGLVRGVWREVMGDEPEPPPRLCARLGRGGRHARHGGGGAAAPDRSSVYGVPAGRRAAVPLARASAGQACGDRFGARTAWSMRRRGGGDGDRAVGMVAAAPGLRLPLSGGTR